LISEVRSQNRNDPDAWQRLRRAKRTRQEIDNRGVGEAKGERLPTCCAVILYNLAALLGFGSSLRPQGYFLAPQLLNEHLRTESVSFEQREKH